MLRSRGLDVSLNEWLLLEGCAKGLHRSSLTGFYRLCRAVLVKSEADYDRFDQVFLEYFKDVPWEGELPEELLDWLNHPAEDLGRTLEELKAMGVPDQTLEELLKLLEERLKEQTEEHNGGSYWVGTQGPSAFGNSGWHPGGIRIGGETLLERTVRLLHEYDAAAEVIITSHNTQLHIDGAERYEPKNNVLEIDRFTAELIGDNMCFLYGDVYYSEEAIKTIVESVGAERLLFIGSHKSICAVLIKDGALFKSLYETIRSMYLDGRITECKGWQVYHLYAGLPLESREIGRGYLITDSFTRDFNSPDDYNDFIAGQV